MAEVVPLPVAGISALVSAELQPRGEVHDAAYLEVYDCLALARPQLRWEGKESPYYKQQDLPLFVC